MVSLRPITDENREAVLALAVSPEQETFVSSVAESMAEAADQPQGAPVMWAVYDEDAPVAFVMMSAGADAPGYYPNFLWKLLVDRRHQRRGIGTEILDLVTRSYLDRGVDVLWTSAGVGDGSPIPFYERYGFVQTGEIVFDGEMLLRLDLRELEARRRGSS